MQTTRPPFRRDRLTWLTYIQLGFYGALINGLGPALAGLRTDLGLSYAEAGLHSSLFAVGMLSAGLAGDRVVRWLGRRRTLWLSTIGLTAGVLVFVLGRALDVTLAGVLLAGTVGSLVILLVPAILSDHHGPRRAAAFSEANSVSSAMGAVAPLLVGASITLGGGWRPGLVAATILAVPALALLSRRVEIPEPRPVATGSRGRLGTAYRVHWAMLVLVISAEFCLVFWTPDFLRTRFGLEPSLAAGAVTVFLVGMVTGRAAGARLALHHDPDVVVRVALLIAAAGFAIFWLSPWAALSVAGVLVAGLGMAGLYPMTLGLAVASALEATDLAASRAALASGSAVLAGPLVLAALADVAGIAIAFAIVPVLLALSWALQAAVPRLASTGSVEPVP